MSKLIIALYVLATSAALVVLKLGAKEGAPFQILNGKPHLNITPYTITGILLYGISFLIYVYLISKYDLGYIIPLTTALVYVLIFTASFAIFKESFTALKITGIAFIVMGLVFLNLK